MSDSGHGRDLPDDPDAAALRLLPDCLEQPESSRLEWLAARCPDRPEVRERVLALLSADRDSGGFLEDGPALPGPERVGERLGPWRLDEEIAIGGMSRVYRAHRADGAYEQQVAVKLYDAAHLDRHAAARFDAERRILAALDHPGIARVIDGGETDDGTAYVVMEYVRGEPITRYCDRHGIDLPGRLQLIQSVCEALDLAHCRGVVHRDIKAGNILVDEAGQPHLIDFGIAKILEHAAFDHIDLPQTRAGAQMLTPEYASPEQLRGELIGPVSDVYSLGVLLYELVTGSRPYQIAGLSPGQMERTVCTTVPQDPSTLVARRKSPPPAGLPPARTLKRRLRGDVDRIIMTALRLEPAQRYPSADALAEDIERFLSGKAVHARGASRLYRTGRFISHHRAGVSVTAAAFVLLLAALAAVERQRELARLEARRAASATEFLTEMIQRADPFENAETPTLAGALKLAIESIDERFAGQPALEADMRYAIGYALQNLGEIDTAREQLQQALALRRAHGGPVERAEAHDGLAIVAWWGSDFETGTAHFERALELLEGVDGNRAEVLRVNVLANWAAMLIDAGDYEQSEALAEQARTLAETVKETGIETRAAIWSTLATAREGLEQNEAALDAFEHTMALQRRATGENHPSYAIVLNNLALLYYRMDRLDDALTAMQRSVAIRRETLGASHPQTATALFNLARLQTLNGDLELAEANARLALEVAENGYEAGHPRIGKAHEALAIVLKQAGRHAEARAHAGQARTIYAGATSVDPAWITAIDQLLESLAED
ncbi:MAG: serine/threonine protein kinase [Pseudomonadota bacterium]|nr:MAG: serine/threonine protein kinase [Pseudomonadota bacterium]